MKKHFLLVIMGLSLSAFIMAQGQGATAKGNKGGSATAGKGKVETKGHNGGAAKVDKSGVHLKGKNGGGVEVTGKKK